MRPAPHAKSAAASVLLTLLLVPTTSASSFAEGQSRATLRWAEGDPGCTFSRDDDGKYRYGLWVDDFGIVLAVDSQELEKVRRRTQPILTVQLTVRYRGKDSLDIASDKFTLEFANHNHESEKTLAPDDLIRKQREDEKALIERTSSRIRKHPEKKKEEEDAMTEGQKTIAEMIDFLNTRSLRSTKLDSTHAEVSGWVYFSAKSRWIDELRKQEEFVLRIPIGNRTVEFPFVLPPSEGDLILRHRPEN